MMRTARTTAVVALLAAAAVIATALVPFAREQLAVRRAIQALAEPEEPLSGKQRSFDALLAFGPRALRFQVGSLLRAIDAMLASGIGMRASEQQAICRLLGDIAATDPLRLVRAIGPADAPLAFRALLLIGRPDLACPRARDTVVRREDGAELSLEWGGCGPLDVSCQRGGRLTFELETPRAYVLDDGGDASEVAALGQGPAEPAPTELPSPGDPRWLSIAGQRDFAIEVGQGYALHLADAHLDLRCLVHVVEIEPGKSVRIRWRVVEAHKVEAPR